MSQSVKKNQRFDPRLKHYVVMGHWTTPSSLPRVHPIQRRCCTSHHMQVYRWVKSSCTTANTCSLSMTTCQNKLQLIVSCHYCYVDQLAVKLIQGMYSTCTHDSWNGLQNSTTN